VTEAGPAPADGRLSPPLLGWVLVAAGVAYAFAVHHGIGPLPLSADPAWYEPRGYFFHWSWLSAALETTGRLVLVLSLPALALAAAAFATCRSALGRAIALSAAIAVPLFLFYGDFATRVWEFFRWRGSAVMATTALVVGLAASSPLLAASWLKLSWPVRLLAWAPFAFVVIAFLRNATGTDPRLAFNISPWPVVAVFGIEVAGLFVTFWLIGVSIAVGALARARAGGGAALATGGVAVGLATPLLLLLVGSRLHLLPFVAGAAEFGVTGAVCALAVALSATLRTRDGSEILRRRSLLAGVGAALVGLPLLAGEAWSYHDYRVTRDRLAREIIDAAQAYLEREEIYPDELEMLVEGGFLEAIPDPAIGFGFLYDGSFRYRSFGTSFILEFPATRWVECAYTPPYEDDDEYRDEEQADLEAWEARGPHETGNGSLGEAWSCPSRPPELW
jgi:hypothetical protein